jgi:hypothetical protein
VTLPNCLLCAAAAQPLTTIKEVQYWSCPACGLAFMDPANRLAPADERARYDQHQNDPNDARYRAFLGRLAAPLLTKLAAGMVGLDYGAGPGPTMDRLLQEQGVRVVNYDPYYAPARGALHQSYHFITCSETAEHFYHPAQEFDGFDRLLLPGGWIGLMTGIFYPEIDFSQWWYIKDPTHVCFYRPQTLQWLAQRYGWQLECPGPNLALFHKPLPPGSKETIQPSSAPFE